MIVRVSNRSVLVNVSNVKEVATKQSVRKIQGLVNRKTGNIRFPRNIQAIQTPLTGSKSLEKDWEKIEIEVVVGSDKPRFEFHGMNHTFEVLAQKVLQETVLVLNQIAKSKGDKIELDISQLQFSLDGETSIEALPGWVGNLDRIQAEELLQNAKIGTYLLRRTEGETEEMVKQLAVANETELTGYLCTVVEEEGKISEFLILQSPRGWTIRADSQDLNDGAIYFYYGSPQRLIESLFPRLVRPV